MKKALNRLLLVLVLLSSTPVLSQIDTVFWFAAPWVTPSHDGNKPIALRISTFGNPTTVRVRQPASTYDTTFTVPANSLFSKFLSHIVASVETKPADAVLNTGLKITSDFPIVVVYEFVSQSTPNPLNPETYSLKGQNGLGLEFYTPFQTLWNNQNLTIVPKSIFCIVASQNNTTVWITPRCPIVGHAAGVTYSITLNEGQSYTAQNMTNIENTTTTNMSGSIVTSDKPISVTVSDDSVHPNPSTEGCYDLIGDQIVPVDVIGTEYIINKGFLNANSNESIFIVAKENFTNVSINDGSITSVLLNKGDTKQYSITQGLTYVQANKSVYVIHMSGYGCEMGEAIIPPLNCAGSNQITFSRTNNYSFLINILCKTTAISTFTLNGSTTLVPASSFTTVPGTAGIWSGAQINLTSTVSVGSTNLLSNSADLFSMGVINGNPSGGGYYHYLSSFLRKVYTKAGNDTNICTATTVLPVNGSVTGGSTTGLWTTVNGTGTFANAGDLITTYALSANDLNQSQIQLVLSSTGNCTPVTDTVLINIFKSPLVNAGIDAVLCKNNITPVPLAGTLQFAAGTIWATNGTGSFGNIGSLNTTYLPSINDLLVDSVKLKLTSTGSLNGCPNTHDSLVIRFSKAPVVMSGNDASVCANNPTIALTGTVTAGTTTGVWSGSGSGLFSPATTSLVSVYQLSAADISQGSVILKLTSTNNGNCLAVYDSLILTVTPKPNVNAGTNDTICSNNVLFPVSGSVTGGASAGIWSTPGYGTFTNPNNLSTIYHVGSGDTLAGQVKLYLTSTGSNCLPEKDSILITIAKAPLVNTGPDKAVCDNQLVLLNGAVTGITTTGVWSTLGTGIFTPDDSLVSTYYQPSALDVLSGSIKLVLSSTYNKGCFASTDTIKLNFTTAPDADFNSNNECAKKAAVFVDNSTTPTGSITAWWWDFGDTGTATSNNPSHSYVNPGTYTVTHVATASNGCTDTIRKPIEIYFLPQAQFYQNTPCIGNITQFVDSSKAVSGSIIAWYWNFGDNSSSGLQNPSHAFSNASTYSVSLVITSSFGCKDTLLKDVLVIPGPIGNFSVVPNPIEALESGQFNDLTTSPAPLVSWNWSFGDNSASTTQNPIHSYDSQGDYTVTLVVKDLNGCIDTVRGEVTVILLPDVPTAFTPNGDGQNDLFLVRGGPFKSMNMRIYNSWGQLIFQSNDQAIGWNGTFNETEQPIGVFVWVVEVEMLNGKKIKKTGDVTLLR